MRRRRCQRWVARLAGLILALALLPVSAAAAAPVPAVSDYGGCLLAQKAGDLLILFDESGSLNTNDSEAKRVTAASYLVRQMLAYAKQNRVELDVGVAGFADQYRQATPWTRLDEPGAASLQQTIEGFRERTKGFETDYWMGLTGARNALVERAGKDRNRCQALVWFTDGRLTVRLRDRASAEEFGARKTYASGVDLLSETGPDQAREAAAADLCRTGGVADQLRSRHITVLAMGLSTRGASDSGFDLMKRIAQAGPDCGRIKEPPGHFWLVDDIDQMLAAFDQVANPGGQQTRRFVLDDALNRVHIFGSGKAGLTYTLVPPDGPRQVLRPGNDPQRTTISDGGVDLSWEWLSDQSLTVDLTRRPGRSWTGLWSVDIVDPSGNRSGPDPTISLSGDLYPAWDKANAEKLRKGDQPSVQLGLAGADGSPIRPDALLGTASLSAILITPDGKRKQFADRLDQDQIVRPQPLDLRNVDAGQATVRLELTYTTAKVGNASTTLDPQQVDVPVTILAPPDSGQLRGDFDFGSADRAMDATGSIDVEGPSCVWLAGEPPAVTAGPADISPVTVTSEHSSAATCLKVPAGQTAPLVARLTTGAAGNGSLAGTVKVNQAPLEEPDRAATVQIPFGAEMSKPLKLFNFVVALIVALVLGPGIPLALLSLAKLWTAKIPDHPLEAVRVPVTVDGGQLLHDGRPVRLEGLPPAQAVDLRRGGSRTATAAGVDLRTRAGRSPFGAGFVEAVLPGAAGVSSFSDHPHGKRRAARLPLAVHNTWAAFTDRSGPDDQATVVLLRGLDVTTEQRREQLDDVQARLPGLLRALDPGVDRLDSPHQPSTGGSGPTPGTTTSNPSSGESTTFDFGFRDDGT